MQIRKATVLSCIACLATSTAHGADEAGKWYFNPQYGYTWLDEARRADDDYHWALGFGKHLSEHWSLELNGLVGEFDGPGRIELDQQAYSLDALIVFGRKRSVSPYLLFGAGYIANDSTLGDVDGPLAHVGVGLLIDIASNSAKTFVLQLRPEVKARYDWADTALHDDFHEYLASVGLAFNFGPAPYQAPPPAPPAPKAPPPPPPPPPAPPLDTDGDGVLDARDQCLNTPRGDRVDPVGCSYTLRLAVFFETNADQLKPQSIPDLDNAVATLKRVPTITGVIEGHTDSSGADTYNLDLSERRAQAVLAYLTSRGIDASRLQAKGFGESQPEADNATAEGRAQNRRVVLQRTDVAR